MATLTSDMEKMDVLGLSLASQVREDSYVDHLRLKSFSYYKSPLFLLAKNVYLVAAHFDDESFSGEGKLLRKYLTRYNRNAFLVDKALSNDVGSLTQYILGRHKRQFVKGKLPSTGDFLFEFTPDVDVNRFDTLLRSSFSLYYPSLSGIKNAPGWRSIMAPNIAEKHSVFIEFIGYGEQLNFIGPVDIIHALRERAEGLVRDWSEEKLFLDKVEIAAPPAF